MFKNMKLGTKIAGGFAIVLLLTAVCGYVGYNGLTSVTEIVGKADDGNRMIKIIQAARQQEKNFIIRGDKEYVAKVGEQTETLADQAKETKEKMNDASDRAMMDDVADNTGKYKDAFGKYVELAAGKDKAGEEMVKAARDLQTVGDTIRQEQKSQLGDVQKKGAADMDDKLWKADSANRIIKLAIQCRQEEKNFILRGDQKNVKTVRSLTNQIITLAQEMKAKFNQQANKDQTDKVLVAVQAYQKGFDTYVTLRGKQGTADETMVASARKLLTAAAEMRTEQKAQLATLINKGIDAKAVTDKLTKADDANRIIKWTLEARRHEKNYMLRNDEQYLKKVRGLVDQIISLAGDMKVRFKQPANDVKADQVVAQAKAYRETFERLVVSQKHAEQIVASAEDYKKAFGQYVDAGNETSVADIAMVDAARELQKVADTIRVEQKAQYTQIQKDVAYNVDDKLTKADDANRLIKLALACRQDEKNYMLRNDEKYAKAADEKFGAIVALAKDMESRFNQQVNKEQTKKIAASALQYKKAFGDYVKLVADQGVADKAMVAAAQEVQSVCEKSREVQKDKMDSTTASSNALMIGGALVAIILGSILALVITRGITKPVNRIIEGLTSGAEQVTAASGQVSSSSQSLAQGATEQAAAVEETTSSIEEMSSMTKQNAGNAVEAKNLSAGARDGAEKGAEAMSRMSKAIEDIKKSSDETSKIIKTIDEIAFQTNLLALNAAVEAARAGDAGKGFAVVAEEVRNLAKRSAEAAKNTSEMIAESVKNADNGVQISQEVTQQFAEITSGIRKVNDLIAEIAAASSEQSQGIEQVSTAIGQIDQVTQSSAATAEESASASEELSAQAEELKYMVDSLRALVEGASSSANSGGHVPSGTKTTGKMGGSDKLWHKISDGGAKKQTAARKATSGNGQNQQKNPEELIPLNEEDTSTLASF